MKLRLIASAVSSAVVALTAGVVFAQANPANSAYLLSATGAADNNVVRSGAYGATNGSDKLCWRTGYWTPAMAIAGAQVTGHQRWRLLNAILIS